MTTTVSSIRTHQLVLVLDEEWLDRQFGMEGAFLERQDHLPVVGGA